MSLKTYSSSCVETPRNERHFQTFDRNPGTRYQKKIKLTRWTWLKRERERESGIRHNKRDTNNLQINETLWTIVKKRTQISIVKNLCTHLLDNTKFHICTWNYKLVTHVPNCPNLYKKITFKDSTIFKIVNTSTLQLKRLLFRLIKCNSTWF